MIQIIQPTQTQQQQTIYNTFTPNIQIINSININKHLHKNKQQNLNNKIFSNNSGKQLTYRVLPNVNSEQENYQKSSENYLSIFKSQICQPQQPNTSSVSNIQIAKQKSTKEIKEDISLQLSPTSVSSNLTHKLNKNFSLMDKKQNSCILDSSSLIVSFQNLNPSSKVVRPFPEHEFWISSDNLSRSSQQSIEDDFLLYPVIQVNKMTKNINYVEYNKKKNCFSIHLQNKLSQYSNDISSTIFEEIPFTSNMFSENFELNNELKNFSQEVKNIQKISKTATHSLLESEVYKVMTSKSKACLSQVYCMNENGSFEMKGIHMNEKFLIYTKWDTEALMMATINNSIQEVFTSKNYDNFVTNTYKSMTSAITQKAYQSFPLVGELRMSDNNVRDVEMSVESTYNFKNGILIVTYNIEKVISERKSTQKIQKIKSSSQTSIASISLSNQEQSISSRKLKKNNNGQNKRKASNSFTFEETSICNDEQSLSQQDKNFLKKFYSF